jgi:hypothetical protein
MASICAPGPLADYAAGTLLTAVSWWLGHGRPKTPEEMGQIVYTLIATSTVSILGVDLALLQQEMETPASSRKEH